MKISDRIAELCHETHVPRVERVFGDNGVQAIFEVMEHAWLLYQQVEPERVTGRIIIFRRVSWRDDAQLDEPGQAVDPTTLANQSIADLVLEIRRDSQLYHATLGDTSLEELARHAVVYRFENGEESFLAGTDRIPVFRLDQTARSQFSVPTLSTLREALNHYRTENIRESTCYIFRTAWHESRRLFFKAGPEETMRNSLTQFLRNRIGGDHDVWPEQNVDESHPVDIRVRPKLSNNRLMLVEIKWLGWSVATDGHVTTKHGVARAQSGASQLAAYLDQQLQSAPSHVIQGYYVIIDGRRNHLREGATSVTRADGMHYENAPIAFDPAPHETRVDFDPPFIMFARPVCS